MNMGITAENVAELYGISRTEQEEFSLLSHTKSSNADLSGKFAEEIVPIVHNDGLITKDGCIRPNSSLESMSRLGPAFIDGGTVTAATSSPLTDGAVFFLFAVKILLEKMNCNQWPELFLPQPRVVLRTNGFRARFFYQTCTR